MLSDECTTILFQLDKLGWKGEPRTFASLKLNRIYPNNVRKNLAFLIHHEAVVSGCASFLGRPHPSMALGPLPSHTLVEAMVANVGNCMLDFDKLTLEQEFEPQLWDHFCDWKNAASEQAKIHPLAPGDLVNVEVGSFLRHNVLWRSPCPAQPLPVEDLALLTRYSRPKDDLTATILAKDGSNVTFRITQTVRLGWESFSQVVFGYAMDGQGGASVELCLKLYDERLFSNPEFRPELDASPLWNWNVAEDMAKREEAAYDRLRHLQGSLLPYSFGFHYVSPFEPVSALTNWPVSLPFRMVTAASVS